jgi:SRSO17 transposase
MVVQSLGSAQGMITVDASEFPKKGKKSVGVARQYCGRLGKQENCQSGVFAGYTSEKGYCLIDCQLYMPEEWFSDDYQDLRQENLVPEDLSFQTKQEIGLELITKASQKFPARWIGCDAAFGSDANFLHSLPEGLYYFADVRKSEKVYLEKPEVGVPQYQGRGRRPSKH